MLNRITTLLIAFELLGLAIGFRFVAWTPVKAVGAAIIVGSGLLLIAARQQLGSSFSVRARASRLVTTGLYARIRHPIYLAGILLLLGVALLLKSWWPAVLVALLIPIQRARARREEAVLQSRFGDEYEVYRRNTWF